jgi:hypothetical protein
MEFIQTILLPFIPFLIRDIVIFIIALAVVYLVGRMLGLIKSYQLKNAIAFITVVACNVAFLMLGPVLPLRDFLIDVVANSALSIIIYVLIGFNLYDRADAFLDKTVGEDKPKKVKGRTKV